VTSDPVAPLDASFLDIETPTAHMHVGWVLRFEGRPPSCAGLRRHVASRLERVPRFRHRLWSSASSMVDLVWADDPAFDVANHVHALALKAPGGPAELRRLAGTLLSQPLDRAKPLWRLYLVDRVERGGFAIVGQAHHALIDGVAALEVAALLLDSEPEPEPEPPAGPGAGGWRPAPQPRLGGVAARQLRRTLAAGSSAARRGTSPAALAATAREVGSAASAALEVLSHPAPPTTLNVPLTGSRAIGLAELGLQHARDIGRRHGGTVNDVVLAATSLALRRYLRRRGDRSLTFKAMVPVNVRANGTAAELGNRIAFLWVDLPLGEADPARTLAKVIGQTGRSKRAGEAQRLEAFMGLAARLPSPARRLVAQATSQAERFNAVVSNVPGPEIPLYLLGRRMSAAYPAVPLAEGHGLSIGVLSYRGTLHAGLYADAGVAADVDDLARYLTSAFDSLRLAGLPRPVEPPPWRARARVRRDAARVAAAPRATSG
jgi:diacylglycerol O-acyltransferase / wax synthase